MKNIKKNSRALNYMQNNSILHYATDGYGRIILFIMITLAVIAFFVSMASSWDAHRTW